MSAAYAAPEQWRFERATPATDVYALGVIGYELLAGQRPFEGPDRDDYRDQHLHDSPPSLTDAPTQLAALIEECLYKEPQARPTPASVLQRLERSAKAAEQPGLAALSEASRAEVGRRREADRERSRLQTAAERRRGLAEAGGASFARISEELYEAIRRAAPAAVPVTETSTYWKLQLGEAELSLTAPNETSPEVWGDVEPPAFEVIRAATISVSIPPNRNGYKGRGHSLWYSDVQTAGAFEWYEVAFMNSPFGRRQSSQAPFALNPSPDSGSAVSTAVDVYQLAWPFEPLVPGDLGDFIERWGVWLTEASQGSLQYPRRMPERDPSGLHRRQ